MALKSVDDIFRSQVTQTFFAKGLSPSVRSGQGWSSIWDVDGIPGAGTFSSVLAGNTIVSPVNGALPYANAASSAFETRVLSAIINCNVGASIMLYDRLWDNGGIDSTSLASQTINSVTWPARDNNGSTNGEGVLIALETGSANMGAASPIITLTYTNSDNVSGRTTTTFTPYTGGLTSLTARSLMFFRLQPGDRGVRSVQSIQQSATWISGTYRLVAVRPIFVCYTPAVTPEVVPWYLTGMPKLYDGSALSILTAANSGGSVAYPFTGFISLIRTSKQWP